MFYRNLEQKKQKQQKKQLVWAKAGSAKCHDNQKFVATKLKENNRRNVATIINMSRQKLQRTPEETLEICQDIAMIVAIKQGAKERKNVAHLNLMS